jgi:hypothetical protein
MGLAVAMAPLPLACAAKDAAAQRDSKTKSKLSDLPSQTRPAKPPIRVSVGVHVLRLVNLDIPNNKFTLDFWIWFRWTDDSVKPYESFELINGSIDSRRVERVDKVDGVNYACLRVQATCTSAWNVARFPLCSQALRVELEDDDLESSELIYVPDSDNCAVDDDFHVPGWVREGFSADSLTHVYSTTYGDPRHPVGTKTPFSRAVFSLQLRRADVFHSFKVFSGLYLAALVAFTVFFVKPDHRLALTVGAIFAVVASHTVISSYLPDAGVLTLADKLHLAAAGVVLVSLFETAYSLHLFHRNREADSKRLDRMTFWITAPVYLIANVWLIMR